MQPVNYDQLMLNFEAFPGRYTKQHAVYTLEAAPVGGLVAGASARPNFKIDTGSFFVWVKGAYWAEIAGGPQTDSTRVVPLVDISLTDTGSERQVYDVPQQVSSVFGTGEIPFLLPAPYLWVPSAVCNGVITNTSAGTTYARVQLSFIGYRVYDLNPNGPNASLDQVMEMRQMAALAGVGRFY